MPMYRRLAVTLLCSVAAGCAAPPRPPAFLHGPYKDLTLGFDPATPIISTGFAGSMRPVLDTIQPGATLTWAFAVGECGQETLGHLDAARIAAANVPAFVRAGVDYVISTGGEGGVFTCSSDAGMEAFIARYDSPRLVGIDFDIEAGQTSSMVEALIMRARVAQSRHPGLRFSFTLPTLAASDSSRASLNAQGRGVLEAIRRLGLADWTLNLMAMDYGPPTPGSCVVDGARCDMGKSALQAAENLHGLYGVPYDRIALTLMIGVNDTAANDAYPEDLEVMARYARERGLAGLHYWSMDRDAPCPRPASGASPTCSGLPDVRRGSYAQVLARSLR